MKNILDINLMGYNKKYCSITLRELIFSYDYELKGTDLICISMIGFLLFFGFMCFISLLIWIDLNTFINFLMFFLLILFISLYLKEKKRTQKIKHHVIIFDNDLVNLTDLTEFLPEIMKCDILTLKRLKQK